MNLGMVIDFKVKPNSLKCYRPMRNPFIIKFNLRTYVRLQCKQNVLRYLIFEFSLLSTDLDFQNTPCSSFINQFIFCKTIILSVYEELT